MTITALACLLAAAVAPIARAQEPPISQFSLTPTSTVAGAHGNVDVHLRLGTEAFPPVEGFEEGTRPYPLHLARTLTADLPPGLVANATALASCSDVALSDGKLCPDDSQIGVISVRFATAEAEPPERESLYPLYNMTRGPDQVARFAFEFDNGEVTIHFVAHVRDESDYGVSVVSDRISSALPFFQADLEIWGYPGAPEHDQERASCSNNSFEDFECGEGVPLASSATYLVNPPECSGGTSTITGLFYDLPGQELLGPASPFPALTGCSTLPFEPSLSVAPEAGSQADQPAAYETDLTIPQTPNDDIGAQASAFLKDLTVRLPQGTALSPTVAQGLGACSDQQLGLGSHDPVTCPESSKIGTVAVHSPLLDSELTGSAYVGSQASTDPASGDMYRLFLVPEGQGIRAKLVGHVKADPATGHLTAVFTNNPQVPFDHLHLRLNGGGRAPLVDPSTCGTYTTAGELVPWSAPETPTRATTSSFSISTGPGGTDCKGSEAEQTNAPYFQAGTLSSRAGSYSPFVLKLARDDGTQRIRGVDVNLPKGLLGRLAGLTECPASALASAAGRSGTAEAAAASCPGSSEVGTLTAALGAGPEPFHVGGHAYLAGPYEGAPLSLAVVVPALAGPFDLGTVVVRSALDVDPYTTEVSVHSDPIPTVVGGVPIDLRSLELDLAKPDFTLNPTSCGPAAIVAAVTSPTGSTARPFRTYGATGCGSLGFSPGLALSLKGSTARAGHPALHAVLKFPTAGNQADIARAQVALPHTEFLDQGNIGTVCTQADLNADTCPAGAVYGHAKAYTPLLAKPLEGPVYLAVGYGHKLPDLVADLNGQIRVLLHGKIDTGPRGGIRTTFETVPDAPVSRFVLDLFGGAKKGLLENSANVCQKRQRAGYRFMAQNGLAAQEPVALAVRCGKRS